ncbi:MAG TPA: alpha/beta fold hydrolase [Caulobacteraceae bacterium]|jgi:pimeloyl-ACP methyl ester carboxylesterase
MKRSWTLFLAGCAAILFGCLLAHFTQTAGGVRIEDVRFTGAGGTPMSGLLYIPRNATPKTPAPGVLAVHGYINSRETQDGFAIEFARRGYVVLALDQTGHGYSGGFASSNGFGGPDGLKYLRSLDVVDPNNIGLEGHSMGGWTVLAAAKAMPDAYKAIVLEGSSTGAPFAAPGTPQWPRNLAVVFSQYDEFSWLMWDAPRGGKTVPASPRLMAQFGTQSPVVAGRTYGAMAAGDARRLYQPATTHPGDHISTQAIGDAVDWFGQTLKGGEPRSPSDQIWPLKELGTAIAFAGVIVLMLGAFDLFLGLPTFAALSQAPTPARDRRAGRWWTGFLLTVFIPVISFYPFMFLGMKYFKSSALFPQSITNQILVWAMLNALITLLINLMFRRPREAGGARAGAAIGIALATVGVAYAALLAADFLFKVDFRLWVVALKLLSPAQFRAFLAYLLPFTAFFMVALSALQGNLTVRGDSAAAQYAWSIAALSLGFLLFIAAQYIPLAITDHLPIPQEALNAIVSIQFLPLMAMVGLISTFTWRRTGSALPGALICGLFVTWYMVAGTATQLGGAL